MLVYHGKAGKVANPLQTDAQGLCNRGCQRRGIFMVDQDGSRPLAGLFQTGQKHVPEYGKVLVVRLHAHRKNEAALRIDDPQQARLIGALVGMLLNAHGGIAIADFPIAGKFFGIAAEPGDGDLVDGDVRRSAVQRCWGKYCVAPFGFPISRCFPDPHEVAAGIGIGKEAGISGAAGKDFDGLLQTGGKGARLDGRKEPWKVSGQ